MAAFCTEIHALAAQQPERLKILSVQWDAWAKPGGVMPWPLDGGKGKRSK